MVASGQQSPAANEPMVLRKVVESGTALTQTKARLPRSWQGGKMKDTFPTRMTLKTEYNR